MPTSQPLIGIVEAKSRELTVLSGTLDASEAWVVVRDDDATAGYHQLTGWESTEDLIDPALHAAANASTYRAWTTGGGAEVKATVIICTVGTNPLLPRAVEAVLAQQHAHFELIVVDNAPFTGRVPAALSSIDDPRLRIVDAPRAGLSHARNAGVDAARGEIIAFTDDDAQVHPGWLSALLDVFAADHAEQADHAIGAVTGPVFPAELKHESQCFFEARGGFPKTLEPTVWAAGHPTEDAARFGVPGDGGPLFPVTTARVGAGVSMAFRRHVLAQMGPFDTRLGAGTKTCGGEDLDSFARVLRLGYVIVTTPDAVIHHVHRRDFDGLMKQTYGDGAGMAALLTKSVLTHPASLLTLARRVPAIARRVAPGSERITGTEPGVPPELTRNEVRGFLRGPWLFLAEALKQRRLRR